MNTQEIINENATKTWKIEQLILLGLSRTEIARLITNGNYGFVQNVYAKMKAQGRLNIAATLNFSPRAFNKRFGVEIEGYGIEKDRLVERLTTAGIICHEEIYNHTTRRHWKVISDASLQGSNTFELVSPILEGQNGIEELAKVCEVLESSNVRINKTCGLHIHFDASGFGVEQVKKLLLNYGKLESEIDSFMPQSRRAGNNSYCQSIRGYETRIQRAKTIRELAAIYGGRYYKVNLQSYARHNTIEFRQHSGTVEFQKISNWVLFLHNLVDFSERNLIENANFETLRQFNTTDIINYIITRQNQLAA